MNIKKLIELYTFYFIKNLLSENERDYIDDDIDFIKYKLEYFLIYRKRLYSYDIEKPFYIYLCLF